MAYDNTRQLNSKRANIVNELRVVNKAIIAATDDNLAELQEQQSLLQKELEAVNAEIERTIYIVDSRHREKVAEANTPKSAVDPSSVQYTRLATQDAIRENMARKPVRPIYVIRKDEVADLEKFEASIQATAKDSNVRITANDLAWCLSFPSSKYAFNWAKSSGLSHDLHFEIFEIKHRKGTAKCS